MGIPHRIVVGDRGLEKGQLEYKCRRDSDSQDIAVDDIIEFINNAVKTGK